MIIGIDAACLSVKEKQLKTGVYHLTYNLLKQICLLDKKNQYLLYSFSPIPREIFYNLSKVTKARVLLPKKCWMSLRLSCEMLLRKPDIFLGLGQALPFYHPSKNIVFVYDLAFENYPNCYPYSWHRLSRQTKYAVAHADKIITISNSTKKDLLNLYGVDKNKIEVIYPGFDSFFSPKDKEQVEKIKAKYKLKNPYFIFIGSLKPIKNIPRIIEAFAEFSKKIRVGYDLVLIGSDFWLDKDIVKKIKNLKLETKVKNLGYLPRENLPALYTGAVSLISPALYEGFGIPLLEAMACGTPVITSNISSMPEVVGKAGILVNPKSVNQITEAFLRIVKSEKLKEQLAKRGLLQVRNFSWSKFSLGVLKLINNLSND